MSLNWRFFLLWGPGVTALLVAGGISAVEVTALLVARGISAVGLRAVAPGGGALRGVSVWGGGLRAAAAFMAQTGVLRDVHAFPVHRDPETLQAW